jgi:hypothetical protein
MVLQHIQCSFIKDNILTYQGIHMHNPRMQLQLSSVMIRHSARHAIELLQMETATVTITNHIQVLECVAQSATRMGTDVPASMNAEQCAEIIFRLLLIMNLMDYNTDPAYKEENYEPYLRWDLFNGFMGLLILPTITPASQDLLDPFPATMKIKAMTVIKELKKIPGRVYWKEMSPIHAMCFNICIICGCMMKRLLLVVDDTL